MFENAASLEDYWQEAVHSLQRSPHVIDIRNIGIVAGIELEPRPGAPTQRAYDCLVRCFEQGLLIRTTGDIIALSPPLILQKSHIDQMVETLGNVLSLID